MGRKSEAGYSKNPVPRSMRVGTFLLSVVLVFLTIWLLGFILGDIGDIDGPDYQEIRREHVAVDLLVRTKDLNSEIGALETKIERQGELQKDLKRSMDNARSTMQQMMDLQRLSLERQATPTDEERAALATAQQRFLAAQNKFEEANAKIAASNEKRYELRQELGTVEKQVSEQEKPAREDFNSRYRAHQFKVASLKLLFIVPLFAVAAWLFFRKRKSPYRSVFLAILFATFWKVGVVMFDYFPRDFFKYIAIVAAIGIVLWFLIWLLRNAAKPNRDLLLKRYREAYRDHSCPICAYPIARGPLRYALWTRKGPRVPSVSGQAVATGGEAESSPYTCPSCGTTLFGVCASCGKLRHSLLPYCEHCSDEQPAPG